MMWLVVTAAEGLQRTGTFSNDSKMLQPIVPTFAASALPVQLALLL